MLKFLFVLLTLLYASISGAVDLKKLDGAYPGFGCEQLVMYVYSAAKDSRDKGYELKDMLAWVDHDRDTIRGKPLANALGQEYFNSMADFLKIITTEIWEHREFSPEELRDMTRTNCDAWNGETENFITFSTMHAVRQQSKVLTQPKE